ncbi:MAG: hypothetical protein M3O46_04520 [Myxococcota bacterium]|nr:hypothetical protein [Myxococcota bacterium]
MNRWIRRTVTATTMATALALVPGAMALAQEQAPGAETTHHHERRHGLLGEALKIDSLTPEQRSAIDGLINQRQSALTPVREADARFLSQLAVEVERGSIDANALAPALSAEDAAAAAASQVERDALTRLHALLTPAQRSQLVDRVEAIDGQTGEGNRDSAGGHGGFRGRLLIGARLGLSPAQRSQIAANLLAGSGNEVNGAASENNGEPARPANPRQARADAMHQALEAFRGEFFDASALVHVDRRGERTQRVVRAMVPVLNPAQRATLAKGLRHRVERESHS